MLKLLVLLLQVSTPSNYRGLFVQASTQTAQTRNFVEMFVRTLFVHKLLARVGAA